MSDDPWSAIDPKAWRSTPHIVGRSATEADVKAGRAVFYTQAGATDDGTPADLPLPACALWHNPDDGSVVPGVIVQAEHGNGQVLVGFRPLSGGNVLALFPEFELLPDFTAQDER